MYDQFSVSIQNVCSDSFCSRAIRIFVQNEEYLLSRNSHGKLELRSGTKKIGLSAVLPGMTVHQDNKYIEASLDMDGLTIRWDGFNLVQVHAMDHLWNRTAGLCGNMDGDRDNDHERPGSEEIWKFDDFGGIQFTYSLVVKINKSENN